MHNYLEFFYTKQLMFTVYMKMWDRKKHECPISNLKSLIKYS